MQEVLKRTTVNSLFLYARLFGLLTKALTPSIVGLQLRSILDGAAGMENKRENVRHESELSDED